MPFELERKFALEAVRKASLLCQKVQSTLVTEETITKKDKSPVTTADFCSQALIIHLLTKQFDYPFIAEEDTGALKESPETLTRVTDHVRGVLPEISESDVMKAIDRGSLEIGNAKRWWTLDPIDGTLGFLRREQYAVALALMEDNKPVLGVLGCPELPDSFEQPNSGKGSILLAVKGEGAFLFPLHDGTAGKRISVSTKTDPKEAIFTESVAHTSKLNQNLASQLGVVKPPLKIDSQCKYAVVARGDSDVYLRFTTIDYKECIWDHAAGVIIVEEAGGKVTDFDGKELDFSKGTKLYENAGLVVANKVLHEATMQTIQRADPLGRRA